MTEALPTRPPVPPCPRHRRHLFGEDGRCARCSLPRRRWSDYDYDGDQRLKGLLCRWLRGGLGEEPHDLADAIHALGYDVGRAHGVATAWRWVRDGRDLEVVGPYDVVELWEDDAGGLYLHGVGVAGQRAPVVYHRLESADSDFLSDAGALADGSTEGWTAPRLEPPTGWRRPWPWRAATLVAVWDRRRGARLTPESEDAYGGHPGRAACRYMGIAGPQPLGTGRAARVIGCDASQVRRLVERGVVAGGKSGHDLECDPLAVEWYARLTRAGRTLARARQRGSSRR